MSKTTDSDPTVPILASEMKAAMAAEGYDFPGEDDIPTAPDLDVERLTQPECLKCSGAGSVVIEESDGTYAGPAKCPRCEGMKIDPGTPLDLDDA